MANSPIKKQYGKRTSEQVKNSASLPNQSVGLNPVPRDKIRIVTVRYTAATKQDQQTPDLLSAVAPKKAAAHCAIEHSEIPYALKHFDELPDSAYVRLPVLKGLFACSSATIWRRVLASKLPKPRRLSKKITDWNVGQLRQVQARQYEGEGNDE